MNKGILGLLTLGLTLQSCSKELPARLVLDVPVAVNSSEPSFHTSEDGTVYLNWYETEGETTHLKLSRFNGETWSPATTITSGDNWFVNWADFPSISSSGKHLAVHYLEKTAEDTYAYQVRIKTSEDQGKTWNTAITPHLDNTPTEHGFVSKVGLPNAQFLSVWLDGRQMDYAKTDSTVIPQMSLRGALIDGQGSLKTSYLIDERTCDCCQTDMIQTAQGPVLVYRDRDQTEVRDIMHTRLLPNGEWTEPQPVYQDEWLIGGCPVNGPAISGLEATIAVAWFTLAKGHPEVKVAFSNDYGDTFQTPFNLGNTESMGRVDIEMLDTTTALISWMEISQGKTLIKLQAIDNTGAKSEAITVTETSKSRSSGFPRMTLKDQRVLVAWTAVNEQTKVEAASIDLNLFNLK